MILAAFAIVALTAVTFYQTTQNGFTNWDDAGYIYAAEPGISQIIVLPPDTIGWIGMTPRKVIGLGAPLQGPTSIVIRDGVLYTANLSFGYPEDQKNKAVVAIENYSRD